MPSPTHLGRAFGIERADDSLGAIVGPLLAAAAIGALSYRSLFALSMIPAVLASLAVVGLTYEGAGVRDVAERLGRLRTSSRRPVDSAHSSPGSGCTGSATSGDALDPAGHRRPTRRRSLPERRGFRRDPAVRGAQRGERGVRLPGGIGRRSDRTAARADRRRRSLRDRVPCLRGGSHHRAAPRSLVLRDRRIDRHARDGDGEPRIGTASAAARGRGFGLLGLVDGVGDLVSSVVVGVLWTVTAPAWGFVYAAAMAMLGVVALVVFDRDL